MTKSPDSKNKCESIDKNLLDEVSRRCTKKALPCSDAFEMAKELGVSTREIGAALNKLDIKIVSCQLACF